MDFLTNLPLETIVNIHSFGIHLTELLLVSKTYYSFFKNLLCNYKIASVEINHLIKIKNQSTLLPALFKQHESTLNIQQLISKMISCYEINVMDLITICKIMNMKNYILNDDGIYTIICNKNALDLKNRNEMVIIFKSFTLQMSTYFITSGAFWNSTCLEHIPSLLEFFLNTIAISEGQVKEIYKSIFENDLLNSLLVLYKQENYNVDFDQHFNIALTKCCKKIAMYLAENYYSYIKTFDSLYIGCIGYDLLNLLVNKYNIISFNKEMLTTGAYRCCDNRVFSLLAEKNFFHIEKANITDYIESSIKQNNVLGITLAIEYYYRNSYTLNFGYNKQELLRMSIECGNLEIVKQIVELPGVELVLNNTYSPKGYAVRLAKQNPEKYSIIKKFIEDKIKSKKLKQNGVETVKKPITKRRTTKKVITTNTMEETTNFVIDLNIE